MHRAFIAVAIAITHLSITPPLLAGMKSDLANCAKANGLVGVRACDRILKSGRLRRSQYYIAYYNRGWAHRNAGRLKQALADFNKSLEYNSGFADTYYSRSVVQYEASDPKAAMASLEAYIALKKRRWKAHYKRALMLRRLGEADLALESIEQARALAPRTEKNQHLKALLVSDLGRHEEALEIIARDTAKDCRTPGECYSRAVILGRQGRYEKALIDLDQASKHRSVRAAALLAKGRVLEKLSRRLQAMREYKRSASLRVESVEELLSRAEARRRLSELEATEPIPVAKSEPTKDCRLFVPAGNMTVSVPCTAR